MKEEIAQDCLDALKSEKKRLDKMETHIERLLRHNKEGQRYVKSLKEQVYKKAIKEIVNDLKDINNNTDGLCPSTFRSNTNQYIDKLEELTK